MALKQPLYTLVVISRFSSFVRCNTYLDRAFFLFFPLSLFSPPARKNSRENMIIVINNLFMVFARVACENVGFSFIRTYFVLRDGYFELVLCVLWVLTQFYTFLNRILFGMSSFWWIIELFEKNIYILLNFNCSQ